MFCGSCTLVSCDHSIENGALDSRASIDRGEEGDYTNERQRDSSTVRGFDGFCLQRPESVSPTRADPQKPLGVIQKRSRHVPPGSRLCSSLYKPRAARFSALMIPAVGSTQMNRRSLGDQSVTARKF